MQKQEADYLRSCKVLAKQFLKYFSKNFTGTRKIGALRFFYACFCFDHPNHFCEISLDMIMKRQKMFAETHNNFYFLSFSSNLLELLQLIWLLLAVIMLLMLLDVSGIFCGGLVALLVIAYLVFLFPNYEDVDCP